MPKKKTAKDFGVVLQPSRRKAHIYYKLVMQKAEESGDKALQDVMRALCMGDLFYLLIYGLKCRFADIDWVFDRCREVQETPDGMLDLWSREHFKSTVITYAATIQEILRDPEITIAIFSVTRPIAKQFLLQIKREFEANFLLKGLFPDILWEDPQKHALKWSEDDGLIVKREGNPKESTLEAWGLADNSQPTSKHYDMKVYDDVVTEKSVTSPEMIEGATNGVRLSMNLGKTCPKTGHDLTKNRFVGTRWALNDSYQAILDDEIAIERSRPGAAKTQEGEVVSVGFWANETLKDKRKQMGDFIFSCQILLDPQAASLTRFKRDDLKFWGADNTANMNIYAVVDPANSKRRDSDYTSILLFGVDELLNRMVIRLVRDRLSLSERTDLVFSIVREFPQIIRVGYEQIGMQTDIEHLEYVQEKENFRFDIVPLGAKGRISKYPDAQKGKIPKEDAIMGLAPKFENGLIWLPHYCFHTDYTGVSRDMTKTFIEEEYVNWYPGCAGHDDMLDAMHMMYHDALGVAAPRSGRFIRPQSKKHPAKASVGKPFSHRKNVRRWV